MFNMFILKVMLFTVVLVYLIIIIIHDVFHCHGKVYVVLSGLTGLKLVRHRGGSQD